jgi:short-subunit dehydrogenase
MIGKILITGASIGIGKEIAENFARDGKDLILVARNKSKLEELAKTWKAKYNVQVDAIEKDLSKAGASQELALVIRKKKWKVDVLVNNAGFGLNGEFLKNEFNQESTMVHLNVNALHELSHIFLPEMISSESKLRGILNVASTAAFQPGPYMSNYYATKAYVLSLSEGLHEELLKSGVHVTCLCPGPTKTEFFDRANMKENSMLKNPLLLSTAKSVADKGYAGFLKNQAIVIPGIFNSLLAQSPRITPRFLVRKIASFMNRG